MSQHILAETSPDDVVASNRSFVAALKSRDIAATADAYTSDAKLVAPSADVFEGRGAIAEFWRAGVDAGVTEAEFEALTLERRDSFAYELGRYTLHVRPSDDQVVFDRGNYMLVHRREEDGKWRRAVEMFSPGTRQ